MIELQISNHAESDLPSRIFQKHPKPRNMLFSLGKFFPFTVHCNEKGSPIITGKGLLVDSLVSISHDAHKLIRQLAIINIDFGAIMINDTQLFICKKMSTYEADDNLYVSFLVF